ncbi:Di-copper centre-containing protein [Basidiobolus meristosporus CBS 931.73]|uniref:Di-copper centre-containing protein n=1 Tax=Basidiobolus meristosporus CBS 931.73 TaxID=1314790 RepID=A0A1Y1Y162_9FUNG|nr:Di-copper centre-containing protein [Basidiobolus meristosporus CBS 931.73]|eukprot:ORX91456.1 Di-copper centre-containing protein [Basidiobolus meristosporus CBS 931.73]
MQLAKKLAVALLLASSSLTLVTGQGCGGTRVRREFRQLSNGEKTAFIEAINTLKQSGVYDRLVNVHLTYVPHAHSTAPFFTWHRAFIHQFENALRAVNPSLTLPYWDWTIEAGSPENSEIWRWFGGNGNGVGDSCLTEGPFGGWEARFPRRHCLSRRWDGGRTIPSFWSRQSVNNIIRRSRNYNELREYIEPGPHATVHFGVGGDFRVMSSPNDPLFWMHHAFVDKIWADWQDANPTVANDYSGVNHMNGGAVALSDTLEPFGYRVEEILSTTSLCYRYNGGRSRRSTEIEKRDLVDMKNIVNSVNEKIDINQLIDQVIQVNQPDYAALLGVPGPLERNQKGMNVPSAIDLEYIKMYGFDARKVRTLEVENALFIKQLNDQLNGTPSTDSNSDTNSDSTEILL